MFKTSSNYHSKKLYSRKNKKISLVFPDYYEVDKNGNIIRQVRRHDFKKVKLKDDWETYRQDGEILRTKNRLMPKLCSFCEYKKHCWENAQYKTKITSKAKIPPQVWYTRYVQRKI